MIRRAASMRCRCGRSGFNDSRLLATPRCLDPPLNGGNSRTCARCRLVSLARPCQAGVMPMTKLVVWMPLVPRHHYQQDLQMMPRNTGCWDEACRVWSAVPGEQADPMVRRSATSADRQGRALCCLAATSIAPDSVLLHHVSPTHALPPFRKFLLPQPGNGRASDSCPTPATA